MHTSFASSDSTSIMSCGDVADVVGDEPKAEAVMPSECFEEPIQSLADGRA